MFGRDLKGASQTCRQRVSSNLDDSMIQRTQADQMYNVEIIREINVNVTKWPMKSQQDRKSQRKFPFIRLAFKYYFVIDGRRRAGRRKDETQTPL